MSEMDREASIVRSLAAQDEQLAEVKRKVLLQEAALKEADADLGVYLATLTNAEGLPGPLDHARQVIRAAIAAATQGEET